MSFHPERNVDIIRENISLRDAMGEFAARKASRVYMYYAACLIMKQPAE